MHENKWHGACLLFAPLNHQSSVAISHISNTCRSRNGYTINPQVTLEAADNCHPSANNTRERTLSLLPTEPAHGPFWKFLRNVPQFLRQYSQVGSSRARVLVYSSFSHTTLTTQISHFLGFRFIHHGRVAVPPPIDFRRPHFLLPSRQAHFPT